jgi:hypothetical protein
MNYQSLEFKRQILQHCRFITNKSFQLKYDHNNIKNDSDITYTTFLLSS